MNAMAAALSAMVSPQPAAQAARGDDARDCGFARCLDQACESDAADRAEAREAPPRPATKARGSREATAPRQSEPNTVKDGPASEAVDGDAEMEPQAAAAGAGEAPRDERAAPDLAALLPGWSPPAVTVADTTAGADAKKRADAMPAASVSSTLASLRDSAGGRAASPLDAAPAPVDANAVTANAPASATAQAVASEQKEAQPISTNATALSPLPGAFGNAPTASSATAPKAAEPSLPTATLLAPIDAPNFAPALATQVRWWANDGVQQAQLMLHPAEMGPVAVKIVLDGREARIDFSADLAATRGAIEAALPVLAAALDDSGLKLSGGGVHDGSAQRQPQWNARGVTQRTANTAQAGAGDALGGVRANSTAAGRGLVDLVA